MATLKLGTTTAISESSGVLTIPNITFPAGHIIQAKHINYPAGQSLAVSTTNTFYDWPTVIKGEITNVLASSHILITIMYSPQSGDGENYNSRVEKSSDGTDSGTFSAVGGTGDVTDTQIACHDTFFPGTSQNIYGHDKARRSIQIIDTTPLTGTNQYRFRSNNSAQYSGTIYLGRSIGGGTAQYDNIAPTTFNLMEIAQ